MGQAKRKSRQSAKEIITPLLAPITALQKIALRPPTPILFLGPVRAGKTTLARLVSTYLLLPHVSLDEVRRAYYHEIGYEEELAKQIRAQSGFLARMYYRQLFDAYSVERVLRDYPKAVIDFGAGVGPYENRDQLKHIQELLALIPNIFLILPSPDMEESLRILEQRDTCPPGDLNFDINRHFLLHPGYRLLAKHIVYNQNKTAEQSCLEVLALLK